VSTEKTRPAHHAPEPPRTDGDEEILLSGAHLIARGGKVDADALRAATEATGEGDEDTELRRVTFHLQRDLDKRLDRYLTDRIAFMSRTQLQRVIREGGVLINGKLPKVSTIIKKGDLIEVVVPPPPAKNIQPENIPLSVLYEDEYLIVINKQPDILVHPARSHLTGTMLSALAYYFQNQNKSGAPGAKGGAKGSAAQLSTVGHEFARPGVVHRLDRHTSGCIVFAKQDEAHWKLGHQFEHRTVDKRYIAVVQGKVEPDVDVIDLPIGNHPSREKGYREKYVVRHDDQGKNAVTICRVRERYRLHDRPVADQHFSLVELELKTGRTHQIRVHLTHLGWPIVGDDMYGGRTFPGGEGEPIIARQALHACVLGFTHPITEKRMVFTAPLRGDMAALVAALRAGQVERVEAPGVTVDLAKALGS